MLRRLFTLFGLFFACSSPALAQVPISGLPAATPVATDILPIVHAGVTSKVTIAQLLSIAPRVTVASYGAVCDSTTNDYAAITAARDAGVATGKMFVLEFPTTSGTCNIGANTLTVSGTVPYVLYSPNRQIISGSGAPVVKFDETAITTSFGYGALYAYNMGFETTGTTGPALLITSQNSFVPTFASVWSNILATAKNNTHAVTAMEVDGGAQYTFPNLLVQGNSVAGSVGLDLRSTSNHTFPNLQVFNFGTGVNIQLVAGGVPPYNQGAMFTQVSLNGNTTSFKAANSTATAVNGGMIDNTDTVLDSTDDTQTSFTNLYLGANGGAGKSAFKFKSTTASSSQFHTISGNRIVGYTAHGAYLTTSVTGTGTVAQLQIASNQFLGAPDNYLVTDHTSFLYFGKENRLSGSASVAFWTNTNDGGSNEVYNSAGLIGLTDRTQTWAQQQTFQAPVYITGAAGAANIRLENTSASGTNANIFPGSPAVGTSCDGANRLIFYDRAASLCRSYIDMASGAYVGPLTGNADTATKLATARAINGTNFDGSAAITIVPNSTDDTTTAATYYPLFTTATGGNNAAKTSSTKLTYTPSTGTLAATTFSGALSGNASTATTSTNATNTAITDDTTTAATMYPTWVTANTGNLPQKTTSTKLTFNPSTGTLASTIFSGALSGNATTATTLATARAINGTNFDGSAAITVPVNSADDTSTNATYYPLFTTATGGNNSAKTSSTKFTFNPSTGVDSAMGRIFLAAAVPGATNVYAANDNAATNGLQFNVPTSSSSGFTFSVNGVSKATIDNTGKGSFVGVAAGGPITTATTGAFSGAVTTGGLTAGSGSIGNTGSGSTMYVTALSSLDNPGVGGGDMVVQASASTAAIWMGGSTSVAKLDYGKTTAGVATINKPFTSTAGIQGSSNGSTSSYLPPVYTNAGAAVASTAHTVVGTCVFSASTSCTPTAFSGAAVFASATSYSCSASGGAGTFAQTGALSVGSQSTTGIIITAATSNSQTVTYKCTGT